MNQKELTKADFKLETPFGLIGLHNYDKISAVRVYLILKKPTGK